MDEATLARAREIAAGLTIDQLSELRGAQRGDHDLPWARALGLRRVKTGCGVSYEITTDLGRAVLAIRCCEEWEYSHCENCPRRTVARVLASQEVDRG